MKTTDVLVKKLYPLVESKLKTNTNKLKQCIGRYMEKHAKELHEIAPYDRIYFGVEDIEDFFKSIGILESQVKDILKQTYYHEIAAFNPAAAKDELTVTMMMVIRYFYIKRMQKELELSTIYLGFSGKFYPSIHYGSFPKVQPSEYRHVMEFVVNNKLSNKFDIKREGSVFGAVRSIGKTWLDSYDDKFKHCDDEDVVYLIQQYHNRIKSFMKNIAEVYYETYDNKDEYMAYDSDNLGEENYRLADNDSLKIERGVEKTMEYLNNTSVDYKLCKLASDSNVKTDEVKGIIELVLNDNANLGLVKEFIRIIISEYFANSKTKDIRDISFITYSITPKPNSKNPNILRQKEIIEEFLSDNSPAYRKRKSREATKNSYHKSVITYFVLLIQNANK